MSQASLAESAGLEPSAVSHFETGRRKPSFANLRRLADALGVTTDYLLGRVDELGSVGPAASALFRKLQHMSADDVHRLELMADALSKADKRKG